MFFTPTVPVKLADIRSEPATSFANPTWAVIAPVVPPQLPPDVLVGSKRITRPSQYDLSDIVYPFSQKTPLMVLYFQ